MKVTSGLISNDKESLTLYLGAEFMRDCEGISIKSKNYSSSPVTDSMAIIKLSSRSRIDSLTEKGLCSKRFGTWKYLIRDSCTTGES